MCWWKASEEGFVSTVGSKPLFKSQFARQRYLTHGSFYLDGNPSSDKHLLLLGAVSPRFGQIVIWFCILGTLPVSVFPQISPCPS